MIYVKNFQIVSFFIISFFFVNAYTQVSLDEPFEWNSILLGFHLDSLPPLKFIKNQNFLQVYKHSNEIKNFQGVEIEQVRYFFYNKKLHSIVIKTKENAEQAQMLLDWLFLMFGEGKQVGFAPRYSWKGQLIEMYYDKNIITHQVEWKIIDISLNKEYEKYFKKL